MNDSFDIFIEKKRIDLNALREARKDLCDELERLYIQVGPYSFDQQKKFLFNPLRLDFPLNTPIVEKPKKAKPKATLLKKPLRAPKSIKEEDGEKPKKKPISLKRPLMKKQGEQEPAEKASLKKKPPALKRPIMKRKDATEVETTPKKKAPPLKRPIMKKKDSPEGEKPAKSKKAPSLKRPIMKPKKKDK